MKGEQARHDVIAESESARELSARLGDVRRRWFALVGMRTVGQACALAAIPILAAVILEFLISPQGLPLIAIAAATLIASTTLAALAVRRMQPRPDDAHVARFVEERAAELPDVGPLDDALVSAVEITQGPVAPERAAFVPLVLDRALERMRPLDPRRLIEPAAIRQSALSAAGGAVVLIALIALGAPALWRAADTVHVRLFPGSVDVQVVPGDKRLPVGSPLTIRATVRGGEDVLSRFPPTLVVRAGGDERRVEMVRSGDAYEFAFESIDRTFTYSVAAGAARSSDYTVTALFPPRVERIELLYQYPAFTQLPERHDEDGGDIYGPAGTKVRVRIHADKPVTAGALAMPRHAGGSLALQPAGAQALEATVVLAHDDTYRVSLADTDGLRADDGTEYYIRLMDDRPPDVRILRPSVDQAITPLEEVTIEARADDDYGIGRFELVYSVGGGPEKAVAFRRAEGTDVQQVGRYVLAAEDLGVNPGDVIAYYARAWDLGRGKRPTLAQSDIFFLEVKPFSEEFVLAESQGGGGGGASGAQLESLIAAQKEIISATWNLERRAGNGLSEADLQRVLEAQTELRAQAEALGGRRGRGRGNPRQPLQRIAQPRAPQSQRQGGDPVATAVAAMTRALGELEGRRMRDAIQHEMEALNGLLAAQAEIRRREVQQQAGRGGGGAAGRTSQDLSALFDRELQRQQRTTYETRNRVQDSSEQRQEESAADRIRDLARRQEEINRQQRDLAAASEEERKRQLERLTREQAALREQAERLLEEMKQRGSSSGGAGGVQQAAEQMRQAAGQMGKNDASSAATSGERAAEQLRRTEQQLRGEAGGNSRTAGDLQVEARQIAQEQRRIASEAERLEGAQGATAEARERLAAEQERLAGRVEDLQRAASGQAGGKETAEGRAAAEAARELADKKVSERMREGARALREEAGSKGSTTGREIARAMDDVADRLGGQASSEAARLSAQLDEVNRTRERLNALEEQLRAAEATAAANSGKPGEKPREGETGSGQPSLEQLRAEYDRELQRARDALGRLAQAAGTTGSTPDSPEPSVSAPGTEAFKQDRSEWASLRQGIDSAIARQEAAISDKLAAALAADRLHAGASERVPDAYQRLIARYYESIARRRR